MSPPPGPNIRFGLLQMDLKAKDFFSVNGVMYRPGDTFSVGIFVGLGLVGIGAADELPEQ